VSADSKPDTLCKSVDGGDITWQCWWDGLGGPIAVDWNINARPTLHVIDQKGVIRFVNVGADSLEDVINSLLDEADE
jgi:hypothetical protein